MKRCIAAGVALIFCLVSLVTMGCDEGEHHDVCFQPPAELVSLCNNQRVPIFVPEISAVLGPGQCTIVNVAPALVCEPAHENFDADLNDFVIGLDVFFTVVVVGTTIFID